MNGAAVSMLDRATFIDRLANHVQDAAQRAGTDRYRDRLGQVGHFAAPHQTLGRVHRDGAHGVLAKVLCHLKDQAVALVVGFQRVQNRRQVVVELDVHNGPDDLSDFAFCIGCPWRTSGHLARTRRSPTER